MRAAFLASLNLQKGEIRQAQFVEDETVMILWTEEGESLHSPRETSSFLSNES